MRETNESLINGVTLFVIASLLDLNLKNKNELQLTQNVIYPNSFLVVFVSQHTSII